MRLPPVLKVFLAASGLLTFLCFATELVCRSLLHWGAPYDYPGVHTYLRFVDFHAFFDKFRYFHSRAFFTQPGVLPYPAPALAAYKLFLIPQPTPHHGAAAIARFEGSILAVATVMLLGFWRALVRRGLGTAAASLFVLGVTAFSFAFWFEFLQGNVEWMIWGLVSLGIWCVYRGRPWYAALCIGVAGSMKLYPIIFVGLLLAARQYRAVVLTAAAACVSTLVSLWLVCPDIPYAWTHTLANLGSFEQGYMVKLRPVEVGFDHSLFALVKVCLAAWPGGQDPQRRLGFYLAIVAVAGCALFFFRIRKLPLTNQVLCLTVAAITLPPLSYDYTLIHLYPGFALLALGAIVEWSHGRQRFGDLRPVGLAMLPLAFLLSPESELIWHGVRVAGQAKCLALLVLGYISLRHPFPLRDEPSLQGGVRPSPRMAPATQIP